jgi:hypothetical protein
MYDWSEEIENGDCIDAIYLDFIKAFDSVPHLRLIRKMRNLGISEQCVSWVKNFLSNRKQFVWEGDKNLVTGMYLVEYHKVAL